MKKAFIIILIAIPSFVFPQKPEHLWGLRVSDNQRYFVTSDGKPFFWLGDTGWLLFGKLTREEASQYLEDRRKKGFNVIQVMVLHELGVMNRYNDAALVNSNVSTPNVTPGNSFADAEQYDYWDHVDYVIDVAADKGLYMAVVPVWGSNVKAGGVSRDEGRVYAAWLANRFKSKPNIIWLNGGDIKGSDSLNIWKIIGNTLNEVDPDHLITFHPFGRTTSSTWFHNEAWLDFNMFQSGHKSYEQDTITYENKFGPDNWKFVQMDYEKTPTKPTLDGEPSYEHIPYGLHDTSQPRWTADDTRRYAYWSVFAGAAGHTYGHSSVMQMHSPSDTKSAYGSRIYWTEAIHAAGAGQMIHLKDLMLSKPYTSRVPDQSLVAGKQRDRYRYLAATRGDDYAFAYTYTGRSFVVNMGKISGSHVRASWFKPVTGAKKQIGIYPNKGIKRFDPPGRQKEGNDWVLILENVDSTTTHITNTEKI